jgi:hypothetical protein
MVCGSMSMGAEVMPTYFVKLLAGRVHYAWVVLAVVIAATMAGVGVPVDSDLLQERVVQEIGWSKARLIAERAESKPEARRAIAFARSNTLPALVTYFKRDGNGVALVTKSFHLTEGQADELEAALVKAGAQRRKGRMNGRTDALMSILRSYTRWKTPKPGSRSR